MIYVKQPINVCSSAEQIEDNSTLVGYPGQSMPKEKVLSTALKLYSARYVMSTSLKPQAREERRLMVHCCNPTCRYVPHSCLPFCRCHRRTNDESYYEVIKQTRPAGKKVIP